MFVYRDAYYLERQKDPDEYILNQARNRIELLVAKNRNGPTRTVDLFCDPGCNVVRDLAR
jgi:replicative DNA helicase